MKILEQARFFFPEKNYLVSDRSIKFLKDNHFYGKFHYFYTID